MLVIRFGREDLANVRFAISPLAEVYRSVRALDDPGAHAVHIPWVASTRPRVADLDVDLLRALLPRGAYAPDFIQPPPHTPLAELEDELAEMTATPADQVRAEIRRAYRRAPSSLPPVLEPFIDDPERAVANLAALVRAYWDRALGPHWQRVRGVLEGDVLYRARQIADGGAQRLFADVHPEVRYAGDSLLIDMPVEATRSLDGRGLLFVPSAFIWPSLTAMTEPPWQPALIYAARGVGSLWEPVRSAAPEALGALIGPRRASVLAALDSPRSTTELARDLDLSPGSVSQHLSVLRAAGLVDAHRVGRSVLYVRSPTGDTLAGGS
jgi:hypothetical protein